MESQGEQNLMCSSSSTIPIEIESRGLMQYDEVNMEVVDETGKRKLSSDVWKHDKVVKLDGARFGVWQWSAAHEVCEKLQHINGSCSSIDRVSCPTMLDEEEDPDVSVA
ncbi:uncharacterized protein [Nicotiana sylvestris]|uniref:Uncharacterized protein LOC104214011 n=1 Tax=Nicotiana sylvestris TaxID=4096 RepID=A0A1U7VA98_NICSY|nr:PREDICTED: uncharacterized protein LOC104214011 [Nicotiana sylvestris]